MMIACSTYLNDPDGIPDGWPKTVIETDVPPQGYLGFASVADYEAYRAARQAAYDAWRAAKQAAADTVAQTERTEEQAVRAMIDALRNGEGTAAQRLTRLERVAVYMLRRMT